MRPWWTKKHLRQLQMGARYLLTAALAAGVLCGLVSACVSWVGRGRLFTTGDVPPRDVAIVLGARVYEDGTLAATVEDRVLTAVDLYRAGKVRKLLMSGDNGRSGYDEPTAMKRYALLRGVPEGDIALDYAGFHTYDTCYRARDVFGVQRAIVVTQGFHLARSVFLCRSLGIDAVGVKADRRRYRGYLWYVLREQAARVRAVLQVYVTRPRPHFLGPRVPILY